MWLHTAARHYCIKRSFGYSAAQAEYQYATQGISFINGPPFPPPAPTDVSADFQQLYHEIKIDLERAYPDDFATLDDLRQHMMEGVQSAHGPLLEQNKEIESTREQREQFCTYIRQFTYDAAHSVDPLPYQRYFSPRELERLWYRVRQKWTVESNATWYPINANLPEQPANILTFQSAWFRHNVPLQALQQLFYRKGIAYVWEFWMRGPFVDPCNSKATSLMVPLPILGEGYWTSEKRNWIIYASHEDTIAFGGDWLLY